MSSIRIYQEFSEIPPCPHKRVVALGNFDGLHMGHQSLIKKAADLAKAKGQPLMVFTFFPQFHTIRDPAFRYLLGQADKFRFLQDLGVDEVVTVPFEASISSMTAEDFIQEILHDSLEASDLVVGHDYRFGHQAQGDVAFLQSHGKGLAVHVMPPVLHDGERVSSTRIRELLSQGQIDEADFLLGYPYRLCGEVVHGRAIGRTIDFPTANIAYDQSLLLPALGVYSAVVYRPTRPDQRRLGVLNIGTRPTVDNNPEIIVEVHILDYEGDLYGQELCVEVHHFIRFIEKFQGLEELKAAIAWDATETRVFFQDHGLHLDD